MRFFLYVSILAISSFFLSCASSGMSGCGQAEVVQLSRADIRSLIVPADTLQTLEMEVSFLGKRLNGMMYVKRQDSLSVRILINSYFGMSMADFEFSDNSFVVHHLMDAMNKRAVVKLFEKDLRLLLGLNLPQQTLAEVSICDSAVRLIMIKTEEGNYRYHTNRDSGLISRIDALGVKLDVMSDLNNESNVRVIRLKHRGLLGPSMVVKPLM